MKFGTSRDFRLRHDVNEIWATSGILCAVEQQFYTDVQRQPVGHIFMGRDSDLTLEEGKDRLSPNVATELPLCAASNPIRAHVWFGTYLENQQPHIPEDTAAHNKHPEHLTSQRTSYTAV